MQLPRGQVADFLVGISPMLCIGFLEHLIDETGEVDAAFHDRLADLYLKGTLDTRGTEGMFRCILNPFISLSLS